MLLWAGVSSPSGSSARSLARARQIARASPTVFDGRIEVARFEQTWDVASGSDPFIEPFGKFAPAQSDAGLPFQEREELFRTKQCGHSLLLPVNSGK